MGHTGLTLLPFEPNITLSALTCLYPARLDLDDPFVVSEVFCGHVSDVDSFFLKRCANGSDAARESPPPPPPADFLFFFAFLA